MNKLGFFYTNLSYSLQFSSYSKISKSMCNFSSNNFINKSFDNSFNRIKFFSHLPKRVSRAKYQKKWYAVFGPGGGFFGVGTSELVVIGIVAWLVLGPKRLYQLARDIGKISGEIKNVAQEAKQTFQQAIDLENITINNNEDKKKISMTISNEKESSSGIPLVKKNSIKELDDLLKTDLSTIEKRKID